MITRISISGLGPHEQLDAELSPRGTTTITGPSESGKSTLVEAVVFALWGRVGGFPVEAIRDGAGKAVVELTLSSGRRVRRAITAGATSKMTRHIADDGRERALRSEKAFLDALGELGRDPEAMALVVKPMAWTALAQGNARALRDVLARVLPDGDVVTEIAARARRAGVVVTRDEAQAAAADGEKALALRRRDRKKQRDEASGEAKAQQDRIAGLEAQDRERSTGGASDVAAAEAVLARLAAWESLERDRRSTGDREAALASQRDWDRRREALGPAPAYDAGALERAAAAETSTSRALQRAKDAVAGLDADRRAAEKKLREAELSGADVCPTCGRDGWLEGAAVVDEQRRAVAELDRQLAAAVDRARDAGERHKQAGEVLAAARAAERERATWDGAARALGPRPEVPAQLALVDDAPARPGDDEVARARAAIDAARAEQGARAQRARELADAQGRLRDARARAADLDAEVRRLDALIDAVREAPSAVAARQAEALGDLGPVALVFGDNPAVAVTIDGRPWWVASRGRQVVADVWLRAGLRRALGVADLPIFIDNAQDVAGQPIPAIDGPVVVLRTAAGDGLAVARE